MNGTTAPAQENRRQMPGWVHVTVLGAFGLLYAFAVWSAVGNLISTLSGYAAQGLTLNMLGWFVWLLAAVLPVIIFAGAYSLGRRRRTLPFVMVMLAGLALVAVFWLNVISYALLAGQSFVG